jgi:UDP:flavonoid glycosyltransferase YjiC (YdhE family)
VGRLIVAATVHDLPDLASDDVHVAGVLPSHLMMPKVDLAVTTAGQGSVQCAMASGTPLIAIPLQPEQELNGQLLQRHRAGRVVGLKAAGTPQIAALAKEVLGDETYRAGARRVRDVYAGFDGPGLAADAILEIASARSVKAA